MTTSPPPTVATWLLQRLGTNPALSGDLIEEYQQGRSRAWYWRQVVMAIVVGSYQDIRAHKLLAFRAAASGWAVLWAFGLLFYRLSHFDEWLFVRGIAEVRWWWPNEPIPDLVVGSIGGVCCGWIVARFRRPSMLLMCVALLLLWNVSWLPVVANRLVSSVHYESDFRAFLVQATLAFVVIPVGMLLGGLLRVSCFRRELTHAGGVL